MYNNCTYQFRQTYLPIFKMKTIVIHIINTVWFIKWQSEVKCSISNKKTVLAGIGSVILNN